MRKGLNQDKSVNLWITKYEGFVDGINNPTTSYLNNMETFDYRLRSPNSVN